ncbi:ABC transporter substrate-binding protein [Pigmentibacter sp. JX0631]|uniref:ABC transporter substrate-binding protein n=1 Tax=Pigmentibacter sp. JX0631 TaxID=2976982 RepID=UPI002468F5B8|nr:ABC transporter substrate-binding protein [Pigmentibacter sp. JX0631]WGL59940.1 ABC transporter substrate-binding protein [Pigmentibacter sp. JX0631]
MFIFLFRLILLKFVILSYCYASANEDLKNSKKVENIVTVTLLLDWKPNTNHIGFYVAKARGFYRQNGIELKILNPTQTTSTALVGMNKADFGVSYANNLIYARNSKIPVKAIAGIISVDTSCFVWRKTLNVKSLKQLEGKRYGGWGSPEENATLNFIMNKNGADFTKVKMLTTGVQDFLPATLKNVDFTWEYKGWNILAAQLNNVEVDTYCPSEHFAEFNKPSPLIITSDKLITENPKLVQLFMHATKKGFEYSINNPESAANEMLKLLPELDSKLVKESVKFLAPLYKGTNINWGYLDIKKFEIYSKWMKDVNLIKTIPLPKEYLSNEFNN